MGSANCLSHVGVLAVTLGLGAAGHGISGPAPAQAAPPCSQWGFDGRTTLHQSNGWAMWFDSTGARAQGNATAAAHRDGEPTFMHGNIGGGIDGYAVRMDVRWAGGELGKYEGSVDANGFASGVTFDAKNPSSTATWTSAAPLRCVTPS